MTVPSPAILTIVPWDGERPFVPKPPWEGECQFFLVYNRRFRMCLRRESDVVSNQIKQRGRWLDCDPLLAAWVNMTKRDPFGIFLDAGANIGSCTFVVLDADPLARVWAVEPMHYNLYYLTRTVLAQPAERAAEWNARLRVYPVALGRNATDHTVYVERGNAGNTVLDNATNADRRPVGVVRTVRLDDLVPADTSIRLLKADVQGFEMELLRGAERLLAERRILAIHSEIATDFLTDHGTWPSEVCALLEDAGFDLHATNGRLLDANECAGWDALPKHAAEIIAVLRQ